MSTLRLTTISNQDGSATVPSQTVISGSAKAWVNFNGTGTVAIRGSFNVTSITDNGTGDYTINFTNAMPNINYCITQANQWGTAGDMSGAYGVAGVEIARRTDAVAVGSLRVWATYPTDQSFYDRTIVSIAIFR